VVLDGFPEEATPEAIATQVYSVKKNPVKQEIA
jgi:hypothetical protein